MHWKHRRNVDIDKYKEGWDEEKVMKVMRKNIYWCRLLEAQGYEKNKK